MYEMCQTWSSLQGRSQVSQEQQDKVCCVCISEILGERLTSSHRRIDELEKRIEECFGTLDQVDTIQGPSALAAQASLSVVDELSQFGPLLQTTQHSPL